jgi:hypothetical protein
LAAGEGDVEIQQHRPEGEKAEDEQVGQKKNIRHAVRADMALHGPHRPVQHIADGFPEPFDGGLRPDLHIFPSSDG